jgi:Chromo (CHRromatin Organisation MOdifier) domain
MWANHLQFLIKWKGYSYKENLGENERNVKASDLIADFYHSHPGAPHGILSFNAATFCNHITVLLVRLNMTGCHILEGVM